MTDSTASDNHRFEIDHTDDGYRARCSCGWVSPWFDSMTAANLARFDHEMGAQGETT